MWTYNRSILYAVIIKLEVENNNNIIVWYLVNYIDSLLHVYNCAVIISVDLSLKPKTISIFKILIESDTGFHNMVICSLFNCMRIVWDVAYIMLMN
jgi:hypothetical protein